MQLNVVRQQYSMRLKLEGMTNIESPYPSLCRFSHQEKVGDAFQGIKVSTLWHRGLENPA